MNPGLLDSSEEEKMVEIPVKDLSNMSASVQSSIRSAQRYWPEAHPLAKSGETILKQNKSDVDLLIEIIRSTLEIKDFNGAEKYAIKLVEHIRKLQ